MAKTKTVIGKIYPARSMFLRQAVGEASNGSFRYELSSGASGLPIVRSLKTGLWFTLGWPEILKLAEQAGINKIKP